MLIEEIELFNILGCDSVHLYFDDTHRSPVYVVQADNNCNVRGLLTLAVQLICSAKYANALGDSELKDLANGGVRIKFILPLAAGHDSYDAIDVDIEPEYNEDGVGPGGDAPDDVTLVNVDVGEGAGDGSGDDGDATTRNDYYQYRGASKIKKCLLINAYRDFRTDPEMVVYTINDGPEETSSLAAFHGRFYICLDYMLPQLDNLHSDFSGDWMELLASDVNDRWNQGSEIYDPFERFVDLYLKYGYPEHHILSQITRAHLMTRETMDVLQKTYVIKILRDTRGIFEFITAGEYTVWFYVPHYGRYVDVVADMMLDELNFELMTTFIQDKSLKFQQYWTTANNAIKDMLLISFQIALGFHCKQQILFLRNFEEICQYQAIQLTTIPYFHEISARKDINKWSAKNYLQRIVDVCVNSGITAIIEYPGGIPLHPVNAYLIKSYEIQEKDKTFYHMQIVNGEQYSLDYFLDCLKGGLKHTN